MDSLGIFGDSFSYEGCMHNSYNLKAVGKSWVYLLRNEYSIENYSVRGCDAFYMYNIFLRNHSKYDRVIFVFPRPGRMSVSTDSNFIHIPNVYNIDFLLKRAETEKEKETYLAYKSWQDYLYDDDKECFIGNMLKQQILRVRPDTKILYGASWSYDEDTSAIIDISHQENIAWNETHESIRSNYVDVRYNHITKENNILFYEFIKANIAYDKPLKFKHQDFFTPPESDKKCYLI